MTDVTRHKRLLSLKQPVGIDSQISPSNSDLWMGCLRVSVMTQLEAFAPAGVIKFVMLPDNNLRTLMVYLLLDQNRTLSSGSQLDFQHWCSLISSHYGSAESASVLIPPQTRTDALMLNPVIFSDHCAMLFNKTKGHGSRTSSLWTIVREVIGCEEAEVA